MPSVLQGQGMRTCSAKLLSAVSWMKSRNPKLGQLLFKFAQRPTSGDKSHFLGYHTWGNFECTACYYQYKDYFQLLQFILACTSHNKGKCMALTHGWGILHQLESMIPSRDPPSDEWTRKYPNPIQDWLPEQPWEKKKRSLLLLPSHFCSLH